MLKFHDDKNYNFRSAREDVKKLEKLCAVGGNVKPYSSYRKTVDQFSKKLKRELPFDLSVLLLDIYSKEIRFLKIYQHPHVHWSTFHNRQDRETN